MTQERTAKISIIIEEEVIERGSDFLVKDIQYLKRTSPTTVEIGLVMSKDNHYEQFTLNIDKKLIQNIFDQSNKVLGLTTQQLKKIHSDEPPLESTPPVTSSEGREPFGVSDIKTNSFESKRKITHLPRDPDPEPVNYKDKSDVKQYSSSNRPTEDTIRSLLNQVFRYSPGHLKASGMTFGVYIQKELPKQYNISEDQARRIYTCQSYKNVTKLYRTHWTRKLNELLRVKGMKTQIPNYIKEEYL